MIQANKDLLSQKTKEQLDLSRGGTLANPNLVAPSGMKALRRPDGTVVYVPATGLIAGTGA
jgi:hypothetical protein